MGIAIGFWALAILTVGSALAVVFFKSIFRAALAMVLCFTAIAGIYVTLSADFLAAAQVLIYVGAIAILLLFGIMLTRDVRVGNPWNHLHWAALLAALLLFVTLATVFLNADWKVVADLPDTPTTQGIANALFNRDTGFILPFEVASVLLLAAIIGAIALVREK